MFRRAFYIFVALLMGAQPVTAQSAGVGAWENSSYTTLNWIENHPGLTWYYNWRTDEIWQKAQKRRSVEYVPMIHGAANINDKIRSTNRPKALLGFNEPDGHGGTHQAGMSVEEAIALWPRLEAHGLRLGSPATTQEGTLGRNSWQRRFMTEVERKGLRVDFMAVHYYSKDGDVNAFRKWLLAVHKEYKRPIWVTEFALIDWSRPRGATYEANASFVEGAIKMMDTLPFVERHAWFAANPYKWQGSVPAINLVDNNMRPTPLGTVFAEVLANREILEVASIDAPSVGTPSQPTP